MFNSKLATCDVDFDCFNQPALRANTQEVPDEEHFKKYEWIDTRSTRDIATVKRLGLLLGQAEINVFINLAKQMIFWNEVFYRDKLCAYLIIVAALIHTVYLLVYAVCIRYNEAVGLLVD